MVRNYINARCTRRRCAGFNEPGRSVIYRSLRSSLRLTLILVRSLLSLCLRIAHKLRVNLKVKLRLLCFRLLSGCGRAYRLCLLFCLGRGLCFCFCFFFYGLSFSGLCTLFLFCLSRFFFLCGTGLFKKCILYGLHLFVRQILGSGFAFNS